MPLIIISTERATNINPINFSIAKTYLSPKKFWNLIAKLKTVALTIIANATAKIHSQIILGSWLTKIITVAKALGQAIKGIASRTMSRKGTKE